MDVTISLSPEEATSILERASASGDDIAGYIHQLIERHVRGDGKHLGGPIGVEDAPKRTVKLGTLRGTILAIAPDFDAPLEGFE